MLKILINDKEHVCSNEISFQDHIFNNANSELILEEVLPADQTDVTQSFVVEPYAYTEVFIDTSRIFFGFVKRQEVSSLNQWKSKAKRLTLCTAKEFLVQEPMDFIVYNKDPMWVLNKLQEKLDNKYIRIAEENHFSNNDVIPSYNTRNMTAYDVLRFLEKQTNSFWVVDWDRDNSQIVLSFHTLESLKETRMSDVQLDSLATRDVIETYEVENVSFQRLDKNYNVVRMESEATLANINRRLEVDLATVPDLQVTTPFPVGYVVPEQTRFLDNLGQEVRPLMIASSEDVEMGKPADIWFSQGASFINVHPRLHDQQPYGRVVVEYRVIMKQNVDFEGTINQQTMGANAHLDKPFRTFRYEKHNDVAELSDLVRYGQKYLQTGLARNNEITVISHKPIWDLGEVVFNDREARETAFAQLGGYYIVSSWDIKWTGTTDVTFPTITYTLTNLNDLETSINYFDSQSYRDNPVLKQQKVQIDNSVNINQNVYVVGVWGQTIRRKGG